MKFGKSLILVLALIGQGHAQVYTPPAKPAGDAGTKSPPVDTASTPKQNSGPGILGQEIPLLDPAAETVTVGGVAIPLGDNRILKARFEKFLSQPPESNEDAKEYRKNISGILAAISPFRSGGPDLYMAFKMLPAASTYPGDANLCGSLAESIYMAMLAKQDVNGLNKLNNTLIAEKKQISAEGDWHARHEKDATLGDKEPAGAGANKKAKPSTTEGTGANSLKYANTLKRIVEIEALQKANIARTEAQTIQTKAQYQVNMVQWFVQRRYEHVLMAARFYNQIWKDGDSTLRIKKDSDVSKLFAESVGVSPTVSSLDSLSNEAIRETSKYVEAFNLMLSRNELHSASQRLMEAFALGEYLAPLATMELEKKRRVLDYFRDLNELYGALQARDYTKAKVLTDGLKSRAKDFPSSKMDSAIAAYTLASDLSIEEAKAHMLAKDSDKAAAKIKSAAEIWPTNPKLNEFRQLITEGGAMVTVRNDFDRLLRERNYREIALRQYEIAPVIQGDPVREDAFKQIMTNLMKIETAIGKAEEFRKARQPYASWEQLAEIREQFPDDPRLGRELELLAPEVADFTRALSKAREFEGRVPKQSGSALSWYLKARSIHPQSRMAKEGVMRVAQEIMPEN